MSAYAKAVAIVIVLCACLGSFAPPLASADNPIPPGKLAFIQHGSVWQWTGGNSSELAHGPGLSDSRWSPTGNSLVYVRSGDSFSDLYVYDVSGHSETQLTYNQPSGQIGSPEYAAAASWAIDPSWAASGVVGFISDAQSKDNTFALWLITNPNTDLPALAPARTSEDNIDSLSLSPDGSIAAYVERLRNPSDGTSSTSVVLRDLTDGRVYPLQGAGDGSFDPAIGPDGQSVAFAKRDGSGMTDIWISNRQGGSPVQVTSGFQATNPVWSPDGKWIAFIRMVDFDFQVWVAPIDAGTPGTPFELFGASGIDAPSGLSWIIPKSS